jgi:uncharacterized membrane protein YeaQ/YmgE (transglycosylase-associated protein family)
MEIGMGLVAWIVVGLIAGFLAGLVMKGSGYGVIGDIIVGVIGGLLGGYLAAYFLHIKNAMSGINLETILVAFVGAIILLVILRLVSGSSRRRAHR